MSWRCHTHVNEGPIHVWPDDDQIDHDIDSDECVCGPIVEVYTHDDHPDTYLVIHFALDRRIDAP